MALPTAEYLDFTILVYQTEHERESTWHSGTIIKSDKYYQSDPLRRAKRGEPMKKSDQYSNLTNEVR
jgi:hypothetical protein